MLSENILLQTVHLCAPHVAHLAARPAQLFSELQVVQWSQRSTFCSTVLWVVHQYGAEDLFVLVSEASLVFV